MNCLVIALSSISNTHYHNCFHLAASRSGKHTSAHQHSQSLTDRETRSHCLIEKPSNMVLLRRTEAVVTGEPLVNPSDKTGPDARPSRSSRAGHQDLSDLLPQRWNFERRTHTRTLLLMSSSQTSTAGFQTLPFRKGGEFHLSRPVDDSIRNSRSSQ